MKIWEILYITNSKLNNKGLQQASIEDILAEVNIEIAMFVCKLRRISDYWLEKHFVSSYDLKKQCQGIVS